MSRLLILSCSERKNLDPLPLPPIARYDGPFFRVARRALADDADVAVFVLSARFGLVAANNDIPWYDERLTQDRQDELREQIAPGVRSLADGDRFSSGFVCAGRDYLSVLDPYLPGLQAVLPVTVASGGLGEKLTRLRAWLDEPRLIGTANPSRGAVTVRGVKIRTGRNEALALAARAVRQGDPDATKCHGWYVPVITGRVAPKWLIHQLTGLPVSRFHSDDARRALAALGVAVLPST